MQRVLESVLENNTEKGEQSWGLKLSDFKTYSKRIVIKMVWYWCKDRQNNLGNRVNDPEIDPHIIWTVNFFFNGEKAVQCRKVCLFNKQCWNS